MEDKELFKLRIASRLVDILDELGSVAFMYHVEEEDGRFIEEGIKEFHTIYEKVKADLLPFIKDLSQ